ncbi:MAG: hypothetical protein QNI93_03435 [Kiloniellales bacterium]|nr:hypothetical protein [Kiloniellales bacterium]
MYALTIPKPSAATGQRHSRRHLGKARAVVLAFALSGVAAFGARAEPVVTDGEAPFHRVYVVGSGDSAQENETLSEDLNALRSALEQPQNHLSINSTSLIQPPLFFLEAVIDGIKMTAQPGDAVTLYLSGRGNVDTFRLTSSVNITAAELANLLDGFPAGVTRTIILDSCFGGSFANNFVADPDLAVIGTSTTCPFNAPFVDFVDTFSEDIAELAGQGVADNDPDDGIVTAQELQTGLVARGWKLGEAGMGDVIENGQSKCDGDCDLPAITVNPPECADMIDVAGVGFTPLNTVDIHVLDSALDPKGDGGSASTDADGAFPAESVEVPTAPTLIVGTDGKSLLDWHFCEAGGGVVPDDTVPSCELLPGFGFIDATVQDLESGLAEIEVLRDWNVDVVVPPFAVGTTAPVNFQADIVDTRRTARFRLRVTDVAGNAISCSLTLRASLRWW